MPPVGPGPAAKLAAAAEANKKATTAMWLSIAGICCGILAIVGIIMGVQANKAGADNGHGTAAIVIGAIILGLGVIYVIISAATGTYMGM